VINSKKKVHYLGLSQRCCLDWMFSTFIHSKLLLGCAALKPVCVLVNCLDWYQWDAASAGAPKNMKP